MVDNSTLKRGLHIELQAAQLACQPVCAQAKIHHRVDIEPAVRRGAVHKIDGVPLGIRFVINMMALDDVPDIPRDTRRLNWSAFGELLRRKTALEL